MNYKKFECHIDTLTKYLNEFLIEFDCEATLGRDFGYLYPKSLITYTLLVSERQEDSFLKFCESLFPEIKADIFLWSFLHELGHHETLDDFDDVTHMVYHHLINSNVPMSDDYYYHLPIEQAATEWAGNFILTHAREVFDLWKKIQPVIKAIYTEN